MVQNTDLDSNIDGVERHQQRTELLLDTTLSRSDVSTLNNKGSNISTCCVLLQEYDLKKEVAVFAKP